MRWLVTGASGFMGAATGAAAAAAGHEVVEIARADLSAPAALRDRIREIAPDVVAHFAGTASVGESFQDPAADFEGSTALWFRLLDAIRLSGIRPRIALASSAAVYGSPDLLPTPEAAPRRPESPYGFHKLLSEQVAEEFARCFGLCIVSLRFFSVFGPRQKRLLVWELFEQLQRGLPVLHLKGTGDEERDFLSVEEAAEAVVGAMASPAVAAGFGAVNVASGTAVSVREVAETLRGCAGSAAEIVFGREDLRGNPARWQADVSRLRELVPGWNPAPFSKSLAICAEAWKSGR